MRKKELLEAMSITAFVIHGNHERRLQTIEGYQEKVWRGGVVYQEEAYPSLLFAKDGEVFDLDGKQAIVMGGVDQSNVDKSTEEWQDRIEDRLDYGKWYCRHYHTEKKIDKVEIMFENFGEL